MTRGFAVGLAILLGSHAGAYEKNPIKSTSMHNKGELVRMVWSNPRNKVRMGSKRMVYKTSFSASMITPTGKGKETLDYFLVSNTPYANPGRRLHIRPNQQIKSKKVGKGSYSVVITYGGRKGGEPEGGKRITEKVDVTVKGGTNITARFPGRQGRRQGVGTYDRATGKASVTFGGTSDTVVRERKVVEITLSEGLPLTEAVRALEGKLSHESYGAIPLW